MLNSNRRKLGITSFINLLMCLFEGVSSVVTFVRQGHENFEAWLLITQLYGSGLELVYLVIWYFALFSLYKQLK